MNRWLAKHVFWPITERLRGRDTIPRYRQLLTSDRWPRFQLQALQDAKLRRLLRHAADYCPFYAAHFREAGLNPRDPQLTQSQLPHIPPIDRADVREHLRQMTWWNCPGKPWPYSTGGSSGEPLRFYIDRFRASADAAARLRARTWWGVHPGDSEILLWGAPFELHRQDRWRQWRDRLLQQRILNAFQMTDATMDGYLTCIRTNTPVCLYGYASSLALLARHALRRGRRPASSRLRAVFVTGEVLMEPDREAIAQAFAAPVVIEYGSRDGGCTAQVCPAGRLHVAMENLIVELLDERGRPVGPGQLGEVAITHLEARATPLIRYRLGDLARWDDVDVCECGRSSLTLAEVRGRTTDQIVCRERGKLRRMHALALMYVLREAEGLTQFRVVQPSLDRLDVEIVANERFSAAVQSRMEEKLRQRVGQEMTIRIHRRDSLPPTASGKHACVVSHVGDG